MLYLVSFLIPLSAAISFILGDHFSYLCFLIAFVAIPSIELIYPKKSPSYFAKKSLYFDSLLYLQVMIQFFLLYTFLNQFLNTDDLFGMAGLVLSMGVCCGVIGINVGHELGHRTKNYEKWIAKLLLSTSLYYHFNIDHNKGHHRHVATFQDPSTARFNESIYTFIIRSSWGCLKSSFKIDKEDVIKGLLLQSLLIFVIYIFFGIKGVLGFILSAIIGIILLECVNYIEHYGLVRKKLSSGRYEKVQYHHSWNSNHILGRAVLFNLSRHSDHHHFVNKHYQQLQNQTSAPQMPTGYPGMIILALIPFLWFKIMNPLVKAHQDRI